jgi:hypothetical protein
MNAMSSVMRRLLGYLSCGPGRAPGVLRWAATVGFVGGGLLVLWSAYIHFHLWNEPQGYRHISIIGPLFLLQSIGGLVVALAVVWARRVWAAICGIGYAISTLVGFLLSVDLTDGLFNFKESWAAPFADQALGVEIAIVVVLALTVALCMAGAGRAAVGSEVSSPGANRRKDRPRV